MSCSAPNELYYSKNSEWISVDESSLTVDVTGFRPYQTGEILFLDLPDEGKTARPGEFIFSMEGVLYTHDLISPVTGTLVEINQALYEDPCLVNDDPLNLGWIIKIEMENEKDLSTLIRTQEYREFVGLVKDAR